MLILSDAMSMRLLDGTACALLAAAATCRARTQGAHFTGAVILGCLCGLIGPLLREVFLHGHSGAGPIASELPDEALIGALGAIAALYILKKLQPRLFFWLDNASIGLASSVGTIYALPDLGIVGAICIGLINGLAPGLVRDIALGDIAMLVEKDWYATASALGCVASIAMFLWLSLSWITEWTAAHADETAAITGFFVVICLRAWKGRPLAIA